MKPEAIAEFRTAAHGALNRGLLSFKPVVKSNRPRAAADKCRQMVIDHEATLKPSIVEIQFICAEFFGTTVAELLKRERWEPLATWRAAAMTICQERGFSRRSISEAFKLAIPSISHAARKMNALLATDKDWALRVGELHQKIAEAA